MVSCPQFRLLQFFVLILALVTSVSGLRHQSHIRGRYTTKQSTSSINLVGIHTSTVRASLSSWALKLAATSDVQSAGATHEKLGAFLLDAKCLGAVRFVVVGSGAILEAVGSFDNLRYADTPKGRLATVSTESPCFECHIKLTEVKSVKNVVVQKFERQLRITRFLGADGATMLSAILHQSESVSESVAAKAQAEAW